jgi:hypothetical protein
MPTKCLRQIAKSDRLPEDESTVPSECHWESCPTCTSTPPPSRCNLMTRLERFLSASLSAFNRSSSALNPVRHAKTLLI